MDLWHEGLKQIRNIYCIGRNYARHAAELGNEIPNQPLVFSKPTHAVVLADGQTIDYPSNQGDIHHELEIVLYIGEDVNNEFELDKVVMKMALGVDFTLRDVQSELKKKGHPWLLAKGFKNSAVLTTFWDFPGEEACRQIDFALKRNGQIVQQGNISSMIFPFHKQLNYIQEHFGLRKGDIIFTGTPQGVGPIRDGDTYELLWGDEVKGHFKVRMQA